MAEKKGYFQPGFASTIETVSGLGALAEKLTFLVRSKLWLQIVVCMVLGIGIGLLVSPEGAALVPSHTAELVTGWLVLPGHLFLALIQMIMLPLVVSSIVLGIAGAEDLTKLRKMGLRIAPYFIGTTTVAVLIGVVLVMLVEPGQYIDPNMLTTALADTGTVTVSEDLEVLTLHDRIVGLIPANPLSAALEESMLQIVVFSILTGVALASITQNRAKPLLDISKSVQELSMKIVSWAMVIAPLAVLGLLAQITMQVGIDALMGMSVYVGTVLLGLGMLLGFYLVIVLIVGGVSPPEFLSRVRESIASVFDIQFRCSYAALHKNGRRKVRYSVLHCRFYRAIGCYDQYGWYRTISSRCRCVPYPSLWGRAFIWRASVANHNNYWCINWLTKYTRRWHCHSRYYPDKYRCASKRNCVDSWG